jgi:ribulose-phosphate 3-epimerase
MVKIVPSILSANFARLGEEVRAAEAGGADRIQIDVMDGHFVPNLTVGPLIVETVRRCTRLPLEVHLMISNAENYLDVYAQSGADIIIVHQEACTHLQRTVAAIKGLGKAAGVALNPATPLVMLEEILGGIDLVLLMTVNPGFGGQALIPSSLDKIRRLRALVDQRRLTCEIEVDGGIHSGTAAAVVRAGATVLVAGSAIFGHPEGVAAGIRALRQATAVDV